MQLIAENIYAVGSPVINKITLVLHGDLDNCSLCFHGSWKFKFKIHIHDKLHLMRTNHIDVNRSPAYTFYISDKISNFCRLKDYEYMTYESWFQDEHKGTIINSTISKSVCRNCAADIYAIIPKLAYEYAYRYFLLNEYILSLSPDRDFNNYMVKSISWNIIESLKAS